MICLPIENYEDSYTISSCGLVHSIDRTVLGEDGVIYPFKGKLKATHRNKNVFYLQVNLYKENVSLFHYVHRLVAKAFIPNPLNKPEVNHKDGNRLNNHVTNLEWVTSAENSQHAIVTGLKVYSNRLTKNEFLECLQCIIEGETYLSLSKRVPYQVPFLSTKVRKIACKYNLEVELNNALQLQRAVRARKNGSKNR